MTRVFPLSFLFLLLFFTQCKKEEPATTLPPATQDGRNTAGFLLDGQVWVPFAKCGYFHDPCKEISARYGPPYTYENYLDFQIGRETEGSILSTLTISSLEPIKKPGEYYSSLYIGFLSESRDVNLRSFSKSSDFPNGKFTITRLDTINQVISGTFNFTLSNREDETVEITDGRFDFQMDACICRQ